MGGPDLRGLRVEGADGEGARLLVPWHIWATLAFIICAGVANVWLATRDIARELAALSGSVQALADSVSKLDSELDQAREARHALDVRVTRLEEYQDKRGR